MYTLSGLTFSLLANYSKTDKMVVIILCAAVAAFIVIDVLLLFFIHKLNKNIGSRQTEVVNSFDLDEPDKELRNVALPEGKFKVYDYSFSARLNQSEEDVQLKYGVVKNKLLSYSGVQCHLSWDHETFSARGIMITKVSVNDGALVVYLAIAKNTPGLAELGAEDMSKYELYASVPVKIKVNSDEKLAACLSFIESIAAAQSLKEGKPQAVDYRQKKMSVEELTMFGYISESK